MGCECVCVCVCMRECQSMYYKNLIGIEEWGMGNVEWGMGNME